jgi:hypothetical protein
MNFLNPEAALKEIRGQLLADRNAYWIWSLMENEDIPSKELELYVSSRLPLGYTRDEIVKSIQIATKAYQHLNEKRRQESMEAYKKSEQAYYAKNSTVGDF